MRLFHPLGFMLASPVETPEEAVERFTEKPVKVVVAKVKKDPKKTSSIRGEGEEADAAATASETAGPWSRTARLAQDDNVSEVQRTGVKAFLEDKYDGMRAQVHCGDPGQPGRVAIYSRNREDVTESFPELEEAFAQVRSEQDGALIFDGEILGSGSLRLDVRCRLRCWGRGLAASEFRMSGGSRCRWCLWPSI